MAKRPVRSTADGSVGRSTSASGRGKTKTPAKARTDEESGEEGGVRGTQSLRRAVSILRVVSQWGDKGSRPKAVAEQAGLSLPTTDRLLRALADEQLLERHGPDKLYRIGSEIASLAAVRGSQFSLSAHYERAMQDATAHLNETMYLWFRVGDAATCLARYETNDPIRVLSGDVGVRRPLGVGASGMAILAFLPEEQIRETIIRNRRLYGSFYTSAEEVSEIVARTQASGYAVNDRYFVPEVASVAMPIVGAEGTILGSIGVLTFRSRFTDKLCEKYVNEMKHVLKSVPLPEE